MYIHDGKGDRRLSTIAMREIRYTSATVVTVRLDINSVRLINANNVASTTATSAISILSAASEGCMIDAAVDDAPVSAGK